MTDIERKLRMFYVVESKDRWEHLLIVADECEEEGYTELAEALRVFANNMRFPTAVVAMHSGQLEFSMGKFRGDLVSVLKDYWNHRFVKNTAPPISLRSGGKNE